MTVTDYNKPLDLLQVIRDFIALQVDLVDALKNKFGNRDWKFLTDIPKRGQIGIRTGELWDFSVHGTGIRFQKDGCSVDMNRHLDGKHSLFDSGRLAEYLESLGKQDVSWKSKRLRFDFEKGSNILHELCSDGQIRRLSLENEELYELC